jgi:hypothetical protein
MTDGSISLALIAMLSVPVWGVVTPSDGSSLPIDAYHLRQQNSR